MSAAGQSAKAWVHVSGCSSVNVLPIQTKLDVVLNASAALHAISGSARTQLLHTRLRFGQQLVGFMKEALLAGLYEHISSRKRSNTSTAYYLASIAASDQLALSLDPSKGNHPLFLLLDPLLLCVIGRDRAAGDEDTNVLINSFEIRKLALMTLQCKSWEDGNLQYLDSLS